MSKIADATARPWSVEKPLMVMPMNTENCERIYAEDPGPENDFLIAYVRDIHKPTRDANARLIVQAVNSFEAMKCALEKILAWEMPPSGRNWPDGEPMSYAAAFGSNGERDHIKSVARAALKLAEGEETK